MRILPLELHDAGQLLALAGTVKKPHAGVPHNALYADLGC